MEASRPRAGETTIEGDVERVTFENAETGFRVVRVAVAGRAQPLALVGVFPRLSPGGRVRARGVLEVDARHGEQLRVDTVTELLPETVAGIERYLASGLLKGVGAKTAQRIVERFGLDTLRVLDEAPHRLAEIDGLGRARVDAVVKGWAEQKGVREVMVFLQTHGATPKLATRIWKRYGTRAIALVSEDPYRLATDVWGVGFRTADKLAESLGVARDSLARARAGVYHALRELTEAGHLVQPAAELLERSARLLEIDPVDDRLPRALERLVREGLVVAEGATAEAPASEDARRWDVYLHEAFVAERRLAARLVELAGARGRLLGGIDEAVARFERETGAALSEEQRAGVALAAEGRVVVVTGGPGVGKTTMLKAILSLFDGAGLTCRLAAPTGRAAQRMSEATGREAMTLHRLLELDPKSSTFKRDARHPLDADAVVVDESSMIDVWMGDALAQAVAPGTRLVLVGDVDQLPSVGPGALLRDAIASDVVGCVRLTRIFRQAQGSLIVTNAHRINAGELPETPPPGSEGADFFVVDRRDADHARQTVVELVTERVPRRFGFDPARDVQVLSPMNKGPLGAVALNAALQAVLNPSGPAIVRGDVAFRLGDKVMQLKNDYDRLVWNGDVGFVVRVELEEPALFVRFEGQGREEVRYDAADLDELTLAYAATVHKSQGSEYPCVVVPLLTGHFVMLTKNLLYTAVTRGRRLVVLVADPKALRLALADERHVERRTRLAERLVLEEARQEAARRGALR